MVRLSLAERALLKRTREVTMRDDGSVILHSARIARFPSLFRVDGFLSASDCADLVDDLADLSSMRRSTFSKEARISWAGRAASQDAAIRNSFSRKAGLQFGFQDWYSERHEVAELLQRLAAAALNLTIGQAEAVQVTRYPVGGFYRPHSDFFVDESLGSSRVATAMIYCSATNLSGGATIFPLAGETSVAPSNTRHANKWWREECQTPTGRGALVKPEVGTALFWWNAVPAAAHLDSTRPQTSPGRATLRGAMARHRLDPRALHAACPIFRGEKVIATVWFHDVDHSASAYAWRAWARNSLAPLAVVCCVGAWVAAAGLLLRAAGRGGRAR